MSLMNRQIKWVLILLIFAMMITAAQGALVSGREPSGGLNKLAIDNSKGELDALVALAEPGWPNPICSIYLPKGESHTFDKMRPGVYDVYYILGKGWNSNKKAFTEEIEVGKIDQPISLESEGHNTVESYKIVWDYTPYNDNQYVTDYNTVTVTLFPVPNGNIELVQIEREDFPKI